MNKLRIVIDVNVIINLFIAFLVLFKIQLDVDRNQVLQKLPGFCI
jgi:hypothetical protein